MKYYKLLMIAVISLFATTACDVSFEEINANTTNPEDATVDVLLTYALNDQLNDFGGFGTGIWDAFTQHQAGNHARGIDYDIYNLNNGHENGTFTGMYLRNLKDYQVIIAKGTAEGNLHYVGVAKIMTALGLGYLTDMYGDIPYTDSFGLNNTPAYDTQADIYATMFTLLGEARADLAGDNIIDLDNGDFIYNGSISSWIAASWALEARWSNHMIGNGKTANDVLTAVTNAVSNGFTSSAADLNMRWEGNSQHSSRWYFHWENNTVIASAVFMRDLYESPVLSNAAAADIRDPRLESYFDNTRFPAVDTLTAPIATPGAYSGINPVVGTRIFGLADGYTGKPNGFGATADSFSPVGPDGYYGRRGSSTPILTYSELRFIEAEAALGSDPGRALTAYKEGAIASIDLVAPYGITVYQNLMDPLDPDLPLHVAALTGRIADYKAAINAVATVNLEDVMTEKFRAMFAMEAESWVDLRRHGYQYPSYIAIPVDGTSGNPVAAQFIQRFLYPQDELDKNATNVPAGLDQFSKLIFAQ